MATVDEVKYSALELLTVAQNDTMSAAQSARMDKSYNKVYDELNETGLAIWAVAGVIPDRIASHVETLMAFEASSAYFVPDAAYARIVAKERIARREIRRLTQPDYESVDRPRDF